MKTLEERKKSNNILKKEVTNKQHQPQSEKNQSLKNVDVEATLYEIDRSLFYAKSSQDKEESQRFKERAAYFQAKLNVSNPQDEQELEADQVAEQVMRIKDVNVEKKTSKDYVPRKEQPGKLTPGRLTSGRVTPSIPLDIETRIVKERNTGGSPLSDSSREFFEPRFNADFSKVRIHNNCESNNLSKNFNAKAFTIGNDIMFAPGQYNEQSKDGKKLLAHELAHTIQQKGEIQRKIQKSESAQEIAMGKLGTFQPAHQVILTNPDSNKKVRTYEKKVISWGNGLFYFLRENFGVLTKRLLGLWRDGSLKLTITEYLDHRRFWSLEIWGPNKNRPAPQQHLYGEYYHEYLGVDNKELAEFEMKRNLDFLYESLSKFENS